MKIFREYMHVGAKAQRVFFLTNATARKKVKQCTYNDFKPIFATKRALDTRFDSKFYKYFNKNKQ